MNDKEILTLAMESLEKKIADKCELITETSVSEKNVKELNELIQKYLKIRAKWNTTTDSKRMFGDFIDEEIKF